MTKTKSNKSPVGVFLRLSQQYIDEALNKAAVKEEIVFCAEETWNQAQKDLIESKTCVLYIAVIDKGPEVQYQACLKEVLLNPELGQPKTDQLLKLAPSEIQERIQEKGMLDEKGKHIVTLYCLSNCEKITPIRMTELVKRGCDPSKLASYIKPKFTSSYVPVEAYNEQHPSPSIEST